MLLRLARPGNEVAMPEELQQSKPGAWQDPRTWMQLMSLLLAICALVGGFVAAQLSQIHGTLQTIIEDKARKTEQVERLKTDISEEKTERKKEHDDQMAYNFTLKADLIKVQTQLALEKERKAR